jgi:hypothetical protein
MVVKRVGPLSFAKINGVLYALVGIIAGAIFSLVALAGAAFSENAGPFAGLMGVGAIVALPIFYGCMGFVVSLVGAAIYNLVAGMVGGVELDVE